MADLQVRSKFPQEDYVSWVVSSLWPGSSTTFTRWPKVSSPLVREWLILPSRSRPRWLLPGLGQESAQALLRNDPGQRNPGVSKVLAGLQSRRLLRWLPLDRVHIEVPAQAVTIESEVSAITGQRGSFAVRLGRHRVNRPIVLQAFAEEGGTCAFFKLATTPSASKAMARETANLRRVAELVGGTSVTSPRILAARDWQGMSVLAMTPMQSGGEFADPAAVPALQMVEFARTARQPLIPLRDAPYVTAQLAALTTMPRDSSHMMLEGALSSLLQTYGDVLLEIGCWHGDWAPWNMARQGKQQIQLWDWEHFAEGVPVGWDIAHYSAQQLRNNDGTATHVENRWLKTLPSLLRRATGMTQEAASAVILSYLIEMNTRFLLDRVDQPDAGPRVGWGIPLVTRLMGST